VLPASLRSVYALADTLAYFCPSATVYVVFPSFLANSRLIPDPLANRYAGDDRRYRDEMRLHADLGFNIIRVWGGSMTERPAFYDAADELGVFVWQEVRMRRHRNEYLITQPRLVHHSYIYFLKDLEVQRSPSELISRYQRLQSTVATSSGPPFTQFWMTGDNNGRWAGNYSWPDDHDRYLDCAADMIRMLRNHPSLLLYVGGNELYPAEFNPSPDIAKALPALVQGLDAGCIYVPSSMSNYTNFDGTYAIAPKDGPVGFAVLPWCRRRCF